MLTVTCQNTDKTLAFAAKELEKYLSAMGYTGGGNMSLGLFADFGMTATVADPYMDDEYAIAFDGESGTVAGSNPRSVLFGVYRFLEACGARWPRPGEDGALLPPLSALPAVTCRTAADKRHRAVCIEGAVSIEHVLDMIDWMPKMGYNAYFIQFRSAYHFFERWYSHEKSPYKEGEAFDENMAVSYTKRIKAATKERGLLLHGVGHGWTCEPFGIPNKGWFEMDEKDIPPAYLDVCALVNGKREVWKGAPINTNLCYSRADVRSTMVEGVVDYLKENPETDALHFWLGDYYNNTCECEECRKFPLSDFYVKMLNEMDARLTEEGITSKVVFLIYYDLMTPPVLERIQNPDRFIMMFAPISRTFADSFPSGFAVKDIPAYEINNFKNPASVDENLAYLWQWEQLFHGDTFDFDYHLMWDHIIDAGGEGVARVMSTDIKHMDALGLHGLVNCQLQRNAFPTSIAMAVTGRTLWDTKTEFEDVKNDLYTAAFGEAYMPAVRDYLATVTRCFPAGVIRFRKPMKRADFIALMEEGIATMDAFAPTLEEGMACENPCHRKSFLLLDLHRRLYTPVAKALIEKAKGNEADWRAQLAEAIDLAYKEEDTLAPVLDCYHFDSVLSGRVNLGGLTD